MQDGRKNAKTAVSTVEHGGVGYQTVTAGMGKLVTSGSGSTSDRVL